MTVAEDGYLTLRFRTRWGNSGQVHYINLVTGTNPDDPFDLVLRQDAKGDTNGSWGDALIAFNLNELKRVHGDKVKLTLRWKSYCLNLSPYYPTAAERKGEISEGILISEKQQAFNY